jgi:hypothetical protein
VSITGRAEEALREVRRIGLIDDEDAVLGDEIKDKGTKLTAETKALEITKTSRKEATANLKKLWIHSWKR